jgi:hypothetical protein
LTSIVGSNLDAIDETALDKLVGIAENDVLDHKSDHSARPTAIGASWPLALQDFANASGGLLIVGMEEDHDTGATGTVPLPARSHRLPRPVRPGEERRRPRPQTPRPPRRGP